MSGATITILESVSASRFILRCACCGGSGEMSRDHDGRGPHCTCSVCGGKGVVLVEIDGETPFVKCAMCSGTGEMSRDHDGREPHVICSGCKGVGAQPIAGTMRVIK